MILYRPVGTAELELIHKSGDTEFPPRLPEQPVFYPVLNEQYACEIAEKWNTKTGDGFGYVTRFEIDDNYGSQFEVHTVGNHIHRELWVPAELLTEFNAHIKGRISVIKFYYKKELTLLTGFGEERVPVKIEFGPEESEISIEYNKINYIGKGNASGLDESFANLQKSLPDGVLIACCNTCRHGNSCPYGNAPYIYCTKDIIIKSKWDMIALFDDCKAWEREVWAADYCSDYCRQDDDHYTYNDFIYYLKSVDSIPLNDWLCSVVSKTVGYLEQHGFHRSGKSNSFYKINSDRTKGCLIAFRQSLDNTPDHKKFGINFVCLTQDDTPDRSRITVNLLKQNNTGLNGIPFDVFNIDETIVSNETYDSFFAKSIRPKLDRILSECKNFGLVEISYANLRKHTLKEHERGRCREKSNEI